MSHVTVLCPGRRIGPLMRARSGTSFSSCRCPSSRGGPAMRAAVVTRFGGPEVIELAELPDPVPGPGQVAIDVTYAAVGLVDIYIRQGLGSGALGGSSYESDPESPPSRGAPWFS